MWPQVPLKSVSTLGPQYGAGLRAIAAAPGGVRYVRITDIDDYGQLRPDSIVGPDEGDTDEYVLEEGDLLFARSGATVGKTYRYTKDDGPCVFAGYLIRFRPDLRVVVPSYLAYYFQTAEYWAWVQSKKRVAAQPNINGTEYAALELPLPPIREQRRIVELLEEANRLRQLRRQADAKAARILPALFIDMFGDPVANPRDWGELPLRNVLASVDAGWSAQGEARPCGPGEFGVLKVSAVTSGCFRPHENKAVPGLDPSSRELVTPRRGDLLFSRANTRELVAATCIVEEDAPFLFLPDKLWRLSPVSGVASTLFLKQLFWNDGIRDKFRVASSGSSGSMLNISQDAMLRTVVPIPPFPRQMDFERHAWAVMDTMRSASRSASGLETIWTHMLQQAFSGQLTAKWRESYMKELLVEMEQQARLLNLPLSVEVAA